MPMRSSAIRLRFASLASWRRAMRMILGSVRIGLASLAKRLVKLAPRFVLSGARPHRLDHRCPTTIALVAESFDVEEQSVRPASVCRSGRGGIAAAVIRESAPAARTGNRKKRSFQKNGPLGLTGNKKGGARGNEAGESVKGGPSCALLGGWRRQARSRSTAYLTPISAAFDSEGSISRLSAPNSGIAAVGPLPARRAGGPAPKVHWSMSTIFLVSE